YSWCSSTMLIAEGAAALSRRRTTAALAAFGMSTTWSSPWRYAIRSSTTPPVASSQHSVYCAPPGPIRSRSLVRQRLRYATASGPVTRSFPRWETSNRPTALRTASCSASTPPSAYSRGIDHPAKAANFAPSATCRSCSGERRSLVVGLLAASLPAVVGGPLPMRATYAYADTINAVTLPRLSLFDTDPAELAVDAIVFGVHQRDRTDRGQDAELLVAAGCESVVAAFDGQL